MQSSSLFDKLPAPREGPIIARVVLSRLALILFAYMSASVSALDLSDYEHTVWGEKEGLAAAVVSISQVPNGMLRLRTTLGNQIFDGVEFHSSQTGLAGGPFVDPADILGQPSPSGAVYYIHPESLRLMRVWKGLTEVVQDRDGVGQWARFIFDPDGIGWYYPVRGLFRLEGLKVELLDESWGIPKDMMATNRPVIDSQGAVWIAGADSLFMLPRGARKFERFVMSHCGAQIAFAPDGSLWCASAENLVVVSMKGGRPSGERVLVKESFGALFFDSRGGFWIESQTGIAHAADWRKLLEPGGIEALHADTMTPQKGLSAGDIKTINEDADGNVWLGTAAGLDRFRATRITPEKLPGRGAPAVIPDSDRGLWVGRWEGGLTRLAHGRRTRVPQIDRVSVVRGGADGGLLVATDKSLWRKGPAAGFADLKLPDMSWRDPITEIAEDDSGVVWLQAGHRLMRLQDGKLSQPSGPEVPPSDRPYAITADAQRQLWFATRDRGPFVLKGGMFREIKSPAYLETVAEAWVAYARGPRVWIGGRKGVGVFEGEVFRPLKLGVGVAQAVAGIVETAEGDLWLHGLTKALRVSAAQVNAGLNGETVTPEVFDYRDGLRGASVPSQGPTLNEDTAGRLWISTNEGLFWIDPRASVVSPRPPLALVRAVKSDGEIKRTKSEVQLSPNPGQVEFAYAAAALSVGDRIRFRYRIEGIDNAWHEAGTRRTAYYTQLPPGRHRFEVIASNEQGQWANVPTALEFEVLPAWYQMLWFRALVVALGVGLLWLVYRLRVSVLRGRERARMREIAAERERIARDLHDTLLQSMQGVILGFQALATGLSAEDGMRQSIENRLDHADQLLGEARDRVRDLRTTGSDAVSLREAFDLVASELAGTARVEVTEEGTPRALRPLIRDRIYLIGREALLNAAIHGKGSAIQAQLQFGPHCFVLRVRDNGIGIDPAVLASGSRPGHYGLIGMYERAAELGAEFMVTHIAKGGTEVTLRVPAAQAFEAAVPRSWQRLRRAAAALGVLR